MDRQDGKYFTIWYGVYKPADRKLAYCNAGHPPALHSRDGQLTELEVDGPAIGMVPELPYATHTADITAGDQLLVYSDGVFEIEKPDGQMWQYGEFLDRIRPEVASADGIIDRHWSFVRNLHAGEVLGDDFSMIRVRM